MTKNPRKKNPYNNGKYSAISEAGKDEEAGSSVSLCCPLFTRVHDDDVFGTVKFVGELPGSSGVWLGVDWDDPSRGRHDGSHRGIRYFNAVHPTSGSFLRPQKVSLGLTLEEALHIRYTSLSQQQQKDVEMDEFFLASSSDSDIEIGTDSRNKKLLAGSRNRIRVEINGPSSGAWLKTCCSGEAGDGVLDRLTAINLNGVPVQRCLRAEETHHFAPLRLAQTLPNLAELNLSGTLVSTWRQIALICLQLVKSLRQLNVSDNRLVPPDDVGGGDDDAILMDNAFAPVVHLVMVRIYYSWAELERVLRHFPRLAHICLAYNRMSGAPPRRLPSQLFARLTYLDIACNAFEHFRGEVLLPFGELPLLETLLVNDNRFTEVNFDEPENEDFSTTRFFPKLTLLALNNNCITSWSSINQLSRLANLHELIFLRNPLVDCEDNNNEFTQETIRQLLIAKLPRLAILNRHEINEEERRGAEIDYLKRFARDWFAPEVGGDELDERTFEAPRHTQFYRAHPHFADMCRRWGPPSSGDTREVSRAIREGVADVTIRCLDAKTNEFYEKQFKKRLPLNMSVSHLKSLVQRLYKFKPGQVLRCDLRYSSPKRPGIEIAMDVDTREISFFNVESDNTLTALVLLK